jgi:hypothetical protein
MTVRKKKIQEKYLPPDAAVAQVRTYVCVQHALKVNLDEITFIEQ